MSVFTVFFHSPKNTFFLGRNPTLHAVQQSAKRYGIIFQYRKQIYYDRSVALSSATVILVLAPAAAAAKATAVAVLTDIKRELFLLTALSGTGSD